MLFIDASVVVAILAGEGDAEVLMARLEREDGPFVISPVVRMEASLSLAHAPKL
ncbi:PIN domain-containing protein [Nitratireductor sp. CH_MIT9313-5]|jgi:ribonuclease VapC|uniref:PIN domain-containing protein n=1 Tax=Nitratireductor sp. CH_MIT9313-5 TaxID=3107764 RepID=UPI00300A620A